MQVLDQLHLVLLHGHEVEVLGLNAPRVPITMLATLLPPLAYELLRQLVVLAEHLVEHAEGHLVFLG